MLQKVVSKNGLSQHPGKTVIYMICKSIWLLGNTKGGRKVNGCVCAHMSDGCRTLYYVSLEILVKDNFQATVFSVLKNVVMNF